jgi:hypothetical protein
MVYTRVLKTLALGHEDSSSSIDISFKIKIDNDTGTM